MPPALLIAKVRGFPWWIAKEAVSPEGTGQAKDKKFVYFFGTKKCGWVHNRDGVRDFFPNVKLLAPKFKDAKMMAALVEAADYLSLHEEESKRFRQAVRSFGGSLPGQDADSDSDPTNESCFRAAARSEDAPSQRSEDSRLQTEAPTAAGATPVSGAKVPSPVSGAQVPSPHRSATPPTPRDRTPTPVLGAESPAVPPAAAAAGATEAHAIDEMSGKGSDISEVGHVVQRSGHSGSPTVDMSQVGDVFKRSGHSGSPPAGGEKEGPSRGRVEMEAETLGGEGVPEPGQKGPKSSRSKSPPAVRDGETVSDETVSDEALDTNDDTTSVRKSTMVTVVRSFPIRLPRCSSDGGSASDLELDMPPPLMVKRRHVIVGGTASAAGGAAEVAGGTTPIATACRKGAGVEEDPRQPAAEDRSDSNGCSSDRNGCSVKRRKVLEPGADGRGVGEVGVSGKTPEAGLGGVGAGGGGGHGEEAGRGVLVDVTARKSCARCKRVKCTCRGPGGGESAGGIAGGGADGVADASNLQWWVGVGVLRDSESGVERVHYKSFIRSNTEYVCGDCAFLRPATPHEDPYVMLIRDMWQDPEGAMWFKGQWFYRPIDLMKQPGGLLPYELILSDWCDVNPIASVMEKAAVLFVGHALLAEHDFCAKSMTFEYQGERYSHMCCRTLAVKSKRLSLLGARAEALRARLLGARAPGSSLEGMPLEEDGNPEGRPIPSASECDGGSAVAGRSEPTGMGLRAEEASKGGDASDVDVGTPDTSVEDEWQEEEEIDGSEEEEEDWRDSASELGKRARAGGGQKCRAEHNGGEGAGGGRKEVASQPGPPPRGGAQEDQGLSAAGATASSGGMHSTQPHSSNVPPGLAGGCEGDVQRHVLFRQREMVARPPGRNRGRLRVGGVGRPRLISPGKIAAGQHAASRSGAGETAAASRSLDAQGSGFCRAPQAASGVGGSGGSGDRDRGGAGQAGSEEDITDAQAESIVTREMQAVQQESPPLLSSHKDFRQRPEPGSGGLPPMSPLDSTHRYVAPSVFVGSVGKGRDTTLEAAAMSAPASSGREEEKAIHAARQSLKLMQAEAEEDARLQSIRDARTSAFDNPLPAAKARGRIEIMHDDD